MTASAKTLAAAFLAAAFLHAAAAEANDPEPAASKLSLELNAAQSTEKGCRLTFVVSNELGAELTKAAFEIALFNEEGVVDRLTVLDFRELPAGKTKVVRFDLAGADCTKVSRVLINHATECVGAGLDPKVCLDRLAPTTRTGIRFGT